MSKKINRIVGTTMMGAMLATGAAGIMAPMASAQETDPTPPATLLSELDAGSTATLTIHKRLGAPVAENPYGQVVETPPGTALEGIAFDVYRVPNIDLTTNAGWTAYSELGGTPADLMAAVEGLTPVQTVTTGADGTVEFTGEIGAYIVIENLEASTYEGSTNLTPSAPFMVALPFTNEAGDGWNFNPHVYPKNEALTSSKTTTDQNDHAGDVVNYEISATVPNIREDAADTQYFDGFSLVDNYDGTRVTPNLDTLQVYIGETLLESTDYHEPVSAGTGEDSNFTISLTRAGLDKLEAAAADPTGTATLRATFDATLAEGITAGVTVNATQAIGPNIANPNWTRSTTPDDPTTPPVTPTPEVEVEHRAGQITINKFGADGQTPLAGAVFELYKCVQGTTDLVEDTPVTVNGVSQWTTGEDGTVTLPAIQVEDFWDNAAQTDTFDYCLVEVQAPDGYELLPAPVSASVTSVENTNTVSINNVPSTPSTFRLPDTGETGLAAMILAGLAAAGLAGTKLARSRDEDA